ncbi:hypothetical protein Btru_067895 [Bulinus truncatus]|nr:hypothetical protein Btru_067895 [Bulinus truncatus]
MYDTCNGFRKRILKAQSSTFEDPCPGMLKTLKVNYECRDIALVHVYACEGMRVNLVCPSGEYIHVKSARYGYFNGGCMKGMDVHPADVCSDESAKDVVSSEKICFRGCVNIIPPLTVLEVLMRNYYQYNHEESLYDGFVLHLNSCFYNNDFFVSERHPTRISEIYSSDSCWTSDDSCLLICNISVDI